MGCDPRRGWRPAPTSISIHAPTWGATDFYLQTDEEVYISIHAPTWGATTNRPSMTLHCVFQSTHPRGVRRPAIRRMVRTRQISIHAPTWGATPYEQGTWKVFCDFNPRTHVGCDQRAVLAAGKIVQFQSTHPRGVRLMGTEIIKEIEISIHAPTWGATTMPPYLAEHYAEFQSTHPRGVRR